MTTTTGMAAANTAGPGRTAGPAGEVAAGPAATPARPHERARIGAVWAPTAALVRAVLLLFVPLLAAVVVGRPDLVVLAVPFAVAVALALARRPAAPPGADADVADGHLVEGGPVHIEVGVTNPDATPYDVVVVRSAASTAVRLRRADTAVAITATPATRTRLTLSGTLARWGRTSFGPVEVQAYACDLLLASAALRIGRLPLRVFPKTEPFEASDAMPRAAGLVGVHRSRRPGDGGELAGIRQYVPGDKLRRIDWRASLRAGELYVAQSLSDRDAELVLLLDVLHDAATPDGSASILDTTVHAAAGIARHYLDRGDRVALLEYGSQTRWLRPGSGRRHYLAVLQWLLQVQPATSVFDVASIPGWNLIPGQALVVLLTPLLEPRSVALAARLARGGRSVVAVDTLPAGVRPGVSGPWADVAHRIVLLERQNTIGQLLGHGVPTVPWRGAGTLDQVLQDVSRIAGAPHPMVGGR